MMRASTFAYPRFSHCDSRIIVRSAAQNIKYAEEFTFLHFEVNFVSNSMLWFNVNLKPLTKFIIKDSVQDNFNEVLFDNKRF